MTATPARPLRAPYPVEGEQWTARYSSDTEFGGWRCWSAGPVVRLPADHPIPAYRGALMLGELSLSEYAWTPTAAGTLTSDTGWTLEPEDVAPILISHRRTVNPEEWPKDVMSDVRRGSRVRVEWVTTRTPCVREVVEGVYRPRRWSLAGVEIGGAFLDWDATITAAVVLSVPEKRWWRR